MVCNGPFFGVNRPTEIKFFLSEVLVWGLNFEESTPQGTTSILAGSAPIFINCVLISSETAIK